MSGYRPPLYTWTPPCVICGATPSKTETQPEWFYVEHWRIGFDPVAEMSLCPECAVYRGYATPGLARKARERDKKKMVMK